MSRVNTPMTREPVETDDRRPMTPARKRRIWAAWEGKCWFCRMPVDQSGPGVVYDHVGTLWITGSDADKDIGPIHAATCNKLKTSADLKKIAKTKRQAAKCLPREDDDEERPPSRLQGRGFDKTHTRGFDHQVRERSR